MCGSLLFDVCCCVYNTVVIRSLPFVVWCLLHCFRRWVAVCCELFVLFVDARVCLLLFVVCCHCLMMFGVVCGCCSLMLFTVCPCLFVRRLSLFVCCRCVLCVVFCVFCCLLHVECSPLWLDGLCMSLVACCLLVCVDWRLLRARCVQWNGVCCCA